MAEEESIHYCIVDKIVELSGCDIEDITESMMSTIDQWINSKIRDSGFLVSIDASEILDIDENNKSSILLQNIPVIEGSVVLTDNQHNEPETIDSDEYYVDLNTGIIKLYNHNRLTKGLSTVKIDYTYGFESVPNDIITLSNLLLAKWAEINKTQASADGTMKSQRIGNYSESFDLDFMAVKSKYDIMINSLFNSVINKYNKGY
jgi:hypothetical protein